MMNSRFFVGLPPGELYGVSQRDRRQPRPRGEASAKRRWQRAQARALGITLKSWLRREAKRGRS